MRWWWVVLCSGCNWAFGLDATIARDAADVTDPDRDRDGVINEADNCPDTPNIVQRDEDADMRGDPCDPCPMDAVTSDDTDGDGIPDACDIDPTNPDCVLLFDSLATFDAANWNVFDQATLSFGPDGPRIDGLDTTAMISPHLSGGPKSIRARAVDLENGPDDIILAVMASASPFTSGFRCAFNRGQIRLDNVRAAGEVVQGPITPPLTKAPFTIAVLHRSGANTLDCTIVQEDGATSTVAHAIETTPDPAERVNLIASGAALTFRALHVTAPRGAGSCPPAIIR